MDFTDCIQLLYNTPPVLQSLDCLMKHVQVVWQLFIQVLSHLTRPNQTSRRPASPSPLEDIYTEVYLSSKPC